jgi:hypothetical protein
MRPQPLRSRDAAALDGTSRYSQMIADATHSIVLGDHIKYAPLYVDSCEFTLTLKGSFCHVPTNGKIWYTTQILDSIQLQMLKSSIVYNCREKFWYVILPPGTFRFRCPFLISPILNKIVYPKILSPELAVRNPR